MSTFKCLSISQPFADLIIKGKKIIELRHWNTSYRGEFLIHSPAKIKLDDCKRLEINPDDLITGAIVGKATIYDVKKYETKKEFLADRKYHLAPDSYFSENTFGFLLKRAKEFKIPIQAKGKLGLFDIELKSTITKDDDITSEIFDEEYRTQWINHH
ncbi:MAG: ASCH domain-containing protein [Candidatus Nitrosotenuis sp.]